MVHLNSAGNWLSSTSQNWWPALPWTQGSGAYDWGWGGHPMMWGAWGIGMMFMMFLFWVLVIVAIIVGIRWLLGQRREPQGDSAL